MTVIGFNYSKISAEKTGSSSGKKVSVKTSPKIVDVKKTMMPGVGNGAEAVVVSFGFESDFAPKVGKIAIEGNIVCMHDKPNDVIAAWEKEKKLPSDLHLEVVNYIFSKTTIEALHLSDALGLPPVVNMPKVEIAKKKK